jgi:hypothetical protein
MEQLGSHWADFLEILIFDDFSKICREISTLMKLDKNKGYFTWRPIYIFYHISSIYCYNDKRFIQKLLRKSRLIFAFITFFCCCENLAVCEIMWKNIVVGGRPQMTIWRMRIACLIHKATNTNSAYVSIFCFSSATIVARTPLDVTLYVHCLSC